MAGVNPFHVVDDPKPLPTDMAQAAALIEAEYGNDDNVPGYMNLIAETMKYDPLTGEPLGDEAPAEQAPSASAEPAKEEQKDDAPAPEAKESASPEAESAPEEPEPAAKDEPDPKGVLTADGKNVIPFHVLRAERETAARLLEENQRLRQQIQQVVPQPAPKAGVPTDTPPAPTPTPDADIEAALEKMTEDYGDEAVKPYRAMMERVGALEAQNAQMRERLEARDVVEARSERDQTQALIDQMPTLAQWQADWQAARTGDATKDGLKFELAMNVDETLRNHPSWQGRSMAERYAEVVRIVGSDVPQPGSPTPSPTGPTLSKAAKAKAEKAVKDASPDPASLSDLPTGTQPETGNPLDTMGQMELAEYYEGLSEEQLSAQLARLM